MFPLRKHREFVRVIALLMACTLSSACTAWHTTSLQPQQFSAEKSPRKARLTLSDGTRLTARHPVMVGDSLVWADGSSASPRDSTRSAVLASSVRRVQVRRVDAGLTIGLVMLVGAAVGGAILYSIAASFE